MNSRHAEKADGKCATRRGLIAAVAVLSILVTVGVDGLVSAGAHMQNPLWPPHAKLHAAMSFHAALGAASVAVLAVRWRRLERADLAIAAFLATAFWAGLILARLWPGTSYAFAGDPAFSGMTTPAVLGVPANPNAVLAAFFVIVGWLGFALASPGPDPARTGTDRRQDPEKKPAATAPRG